MSAWTTRQRSRPVGSATRVAWAHGRAPSQSTPTSGSVGCVEDRGERPVPDQVGEVGDAEVDVWVVGELGVGGAEGEHRPLTPLQGFWAGGAGEQAQDEREDGVVLAPRRLRLPFGDVGVEGGVAGELGGERVDGLGGAVDLQEGVVEGEPVVRGVLEVGQDGVGDHRGAAVPGAWRAGGVRDLVAPRQGAAVVAALARRRS